MRRWLWFVVLVALMALVVASSAGAESVSETAGSKKKLPRVSRVIDGDTIRLTNGKSVRLLQIDTPELQESECYGTQAKQALTRLLPRGTRVTLQSDPGLDKVDQYGRLLRYVIKRGTNLNIQLVRLGAASVWFYQGEQGRYASQLLAAAEAAQASSRGLWASCPGTVFDPTQAVDTRPANPPPVSACSDGIDNDIDRLIDYPADPGCASSTDTDETNMAAAACADGLDNDTDGLTDYPATLAARTRPTRSRRPRATSATTASTTTATDSSTTPTTLLVPVQRTPPKPRPATATPPTPASASPRRHPTSTAATSPTRTSPFSPPIRTTSTATTTESAARLSRAPLAHDCVCDRVRPGRGRNRVGRQLAADRRGALVQ